jgi:hypothetical protein
MNAEAYLRKQGWQGSGHSLDQSGRGIKKPLLIAHKNDQLGLGKKKAAHTTDDQWWLRAFDQSLQSIGTGKDVCNHVFLHVRDQTTDLPHRAHSTRFERRASIAAVYMASS